MTSYLRRAAKSDLKALSVVRDLSEQKKSEAQSTMPHFAYLKRCAMAPRSDSNITPNSLGVLMRKT